MTNYVIVKIGYKNKNGALEKKFIIKGKRSFMEDKDTAFIKYSNVIKENSTQMMWAKSTIPGFRAYGRNITWGMNSDGYITVNYATSKVAAEFLYEIG